MKEQQDKHPHNLVITAWQHSCPQHGRHIVVYGTDCPTTQKMNAQVLYDDCSEACDWISQPHQYTIPLPIADDSMPWEDVVKEAFGDDFGFVIIDE